MTTMEQEPFDKWPEAWLMKDNCEDQCAENRLEPNVPITPEQMAELGISYWKLDADAYTYPDVSIPWNPSDAKDPKLQKIREDRGYSYADIITVHPDYLPGYSDKIKSFFEEHIHDAEEIRYVLAGSGYFDVRDLNDKWVRVHVKKGDFMTLPEGTYIQDNWQRRSIAFMSSPLGLLWESTTISHVIIWPFFINCFFIIFFLINRYLSSLHLRQQ